MATRNISKDQWHHFRVPLDGLSYDPRAAPSRWRRRTSIIDHRVIGPQEVFADGQAGGVINVEIIGSGDVRMIGEPLMLTEPQDVRDGRKGRPKERGCKMVDKTADKPRSREAEVEQSILDEALEQTFPASDPVAVVLPKPATRDGEDAQVPC